ncbi:MAG: hypothetical protein OEV59_05710 [Deltaproteobacteria bacterium]|nr:hypothetical protein [Deltaproteobacteria bacterium]
MNEAYVKRRVSGLAAMSVFAMLLAFYGCAAPSKGPAVKSSSNAGTGRGAAAAEAPELKTEARTATPALAGGSLVYGYIDMHEVSTKIVAVTVQNASNNKTYKCVAVDDVFWAGGLSPGVYRLLSFESAKGATYHASDFIKSDTEVSGRQGELLFMGSYKFRKTGSSNADFDLVRRKFPGEKEALEVLLKHNKGEWWDKAIRTRLASL